MNGIAPASNPRLPVHDDGPAACTGEWMATRWPLVAWAALDGSVQRCDSLAAAKGAAAVAHGVAHLLLLVADARKLPGDRAAQG